MKGYSYKIGKRAKVRKVWRFIAILALPTFLLSGLFFILFSTSFRVSQIEVEGTTEINKGDVENALLELTSGYKYKILPRSNIFILRTNYLEEQLLGEFSAVEDVKVSRKGLNKLGVYVIERQPHFVWCKGEECFYIDKKGVIFDFATSTQNMTIFHTPLEGGVLGQSVAQGKVLENIFTAIDYFSSRSILIYSVDLLSDNKLSIDTSIGTVILESEEKKIDEVLENVLLLYENQKQKKGSDLHFEYIDARFGNKLFFKIEE